MSVIFFGASELGFNCCSLLIENGIEVNAIFSIPKEFSIKYKQSSERQLVNNVLYRDFSFFKEKYNIPVIFVEGNVKEHKDFIQELKPELIIVIGWYYMIPNDILLIPVKGSVAIHASLLPKYRGNAPLVWAIIHGENRSGISLFYISDGIDNGDIVAQKSFQIEKEDKIADILVKAEDASLAVISSEIPKILNATASRIPQNHEEMTYYPKRTPLDGEINWQWDNVKIKNFIRAQSQPYPGAFTIIDNKKVIIWNADIENV